jgi:hypothetical protein
MSGFAQQLSDELASLHLGQRAWFWCCPGHADAPLLLSPLQTDPRMEALQARTRGLSVSRFAPRAVGLAHVAENGAIQLGGAGFSEDMLPAIAQWVSDHVGDVPGLARLKGLRSVRLSDDGTVAERFSGAGLWEGVPDVPAPGTIGDTARRLARLRPGKQGWFWMVERGPLLVLGSQRNDPEGAAFTETVRVLGRRFPAPGRQASGMLRAEEAGLFFTSTSPLDDGHVILGALFRRHAALRPALTGARVVRLDGGRAIEATAPLEDLSHTVASLEGLAPGGEQRFFSAPDAPLLLAENDEALRAAVVARGLRGGTRGRLVDAGRGWLHFTTRAPADGLIERLARWSGQHRAAWPSLQRLAGARATQLDGDRKPVSRYRNDDAWEVSSAR